MGVHVAGPHPCASFKKLIQVLQPSASRLSPACLVHCVRWWWPCSFVQHYEASMKVEYDTNDLLTACTCHMHTSPYTVHSVPQPARIALPAAIILLHADPWQHIVCCVLCSRTSGSDSIRSAIADFFSLFPSPTAVLEADDAAIKAVIHPLGLQLDRLAAVRAVARDFLATDWQEPAQFKGCGKFVTDSWRIFCKGSRVAKGDKAWDCSGAGER